MIFRHSSPRTVQRALFIACTLCIFASVQTRAQAEPPSAFSVREAAVKLDSALESIEYVSRAIPKCTTPQDKRSLYAFLGSLQESLALYKDAERSYSAACAIAAGDAEGMQKKSNESLVLDAVRCALSSGEHSSALSYLNTIASAQDPKVKSLAALYKEWAHLSAATDERELSLPLSRLKSYLSDSAFDDVKPKILLTLWYVGADNEAAAALSREAKDSIEAAIVQGKARMLPVPFWYFMVRKTPSSTSASLPVPQGTQPACGPVCQKQPPLLEEHPPAPAPEPERSGTRTKKRKSSKTPSAPVASSASYTRIQLGLFRDRENALRLVSTLKDKGFSPDITSEKRASGTLYYIVVIDNPTPQTEAALRTAGFEFYPVF